MFSKLNFIEKLPEIYKKQELWEIMSITLYKLNSFIECAIVLQYIEKNSIANFLLLIEKINSIPSYYIDFLIDLFFLEKLIEKFYLMGDQNETIQKLVK